MEFYREIMNSDLLNISNLPKELKHKRVEVIILPYEEEIKTIDLKTGLKNVSGIWKNVDIDLEKIREKAWKR